MEESIKELAERIRLQRGIHSYFEQKARLLGCILSVFSILLPSIITFLAISDILFLKIFLPKITDQYLKIALGLSGFILFISSTLDKCFSLQDKHKEYRRAVELYSDLLHEIYAIQIDLVNEEAKRIKYNELRKRYLLISYRTPKFTNKMFLRGKFYYLRRQKTVQIKEQNPFAWPWQVSKIASRELK